MAFKGEGAFLATGKALQSVASGFAAAQGAMGLFGSLGETEQSTKSLKQQLKEATAVFKELEYPPIEALELFKPFKYLPNDSSDWSNNSFIVFCVKVPFCKLKLYFPIMFSASEKGCTTCFENILPKLCPSFFNCLISSMVLPKIENCPF